MTRNTRFCFLTVLYKNINAIIKYNIIIFTFCNLSLYEKKNPRDHRYNIIFEFLFFCWPSQQLARHNSSFIIIII